MTGDDWGPAFGADDPAPKPPKPQKADSTPGLVQYFKDHLPVDAWGTLNAPVNASALSVGISKLKKAGYSPEQIRGMMDTYLQRISQKPLPVGIAPWRGFLANLDSLATTATSKEDSYDDLEPDHRI